MAPRLKKKSTGPFTKFQSNELFGISNENQFFLLFRLPRFFLQSLLSSASVVPPSRIRSHQRCQTLESRLRTSSGSSRMTCCLTPGPMEPRTSADRILMRPPLRDCGLRKLTRAYTTAPVCSSSRSAFILGCWTLNPQCDHAVAPECGQCQLKTKTQIFYRFDRFDCLYNGGE